MFFSSEMEVNMARKAWCEVYGELLQKETCFQAKAYLCVSIILALYSLFFLLLSPVNGLLT